MTRKKECPFGIRVRFCKYQKTYARDIFSAVEGRLLFLCMLGKVGDCPELKDIVNEETRPLRQPHLYHT